MGRKEGGIVYIRGIDAHHDSDMICFNQVNAMHMLMLAFQKVISVKVEDLL